MKSIEDALISQDSSINTTPYACARGCACLCMRGTGRIGTRPEDEAVRGYDDLTASETNLYIITIPTRPRALAPMINGYV